MTGTADGLGANLLTTGVKPSVICCNLLYISAAMTPASAGALLKPNDLLTLACMGVGAEADGILLKQQKRQDRICSEHSHRAQCVVPASRERQGRATPHPEVVEGCMLWVFVAMDWVCLHMPGITSPL